MSLPVPSPHANTGGGSPSRSASSRQDRSRQHRNDADHPKHHFPDPSGLTKQSSLPLPNSTYTIPHFGITITRSLSATVTTTCVATLKAGHRLIDTSQLYNNETQLSHAARSVLQSDNENLTPIPRSSIFYSTKILFPRSTPESTFISISESVENLDFQEDGSGYVDLFSIASPHGGFESRKALWEALERAKKEGIVRDIGVCNFSIQHLEEMKSYAKIWPPAVNQLELHPWCQQRDLVDYCRYNRIVVATYCPLVRGTKVYDPTLVALAGKYRRKPNEILARYALQKGWVVLVRETGKVKVRDVVAVENVDVFEWAVQEVDMRILDGLDRDGEGAVMRGVPG